MKTTYAARADNLRRLVLTMRPDLAEPSEALARARAAAFTGRIDSGPYVADGHGVPRYNYVNLGLRRPDAGVSLNMSVYADASIDPKVHMAWIDGKQTGDYDRAVELLGADPKVIARGLIDPATARRCAYASRIEWALKAASGLLGAIDTWQEYPRKRWAQRSLARAETKAADVLRELIEAEAAYGTLTPAA